MSSSYLWGFLAGALWASFASESYEFVPMALVGTVIVALLNLLYTVSRKWWWPRVAAWRDERAHRAAFDVKIEAMVSEFRDDARRRHMSTRINTQESEVDHV